MSLPPSCRCTPTECGNSLIGGTCDPPGWCLDVRAPCVPTQWGNGVPYPEGTHPPPQVPGAFGATANTDGASPGELATGAIFVVAGIASYKQLREAPLLLVLGAAGLAAIVFLGDGLAAVPWWVWSAAAVAVVMCVLGTSGADALTNVALAESLLE